MESPPVVRVKTSPYFMGGCFFGGLAARCPRYLAFSIWLFYSLSNRHSSSIVFPRLGASLELRHRMMPDSEYFEADEFFLKSAINSLKSASRSELDFFG